MQHIAYLFSTTPHPDSVAEIASLWNQHISAQLFSLTPHALAGLRIFPSPEPGSGLAHPQLKFPAIITRETGLKVHALAPMIRHFDHICAQDGEEAAYAAYALSQLTGIPFSFSTRDHDLTCFNPALAEIAAHAAWIVTGSTYGQHALQELYGITSRKITVMPSSVDLDYFQRTHESESETPRLVCAGPLNADHVYILQAATVLHRQGVAFRLQFVGEGEKRGELERMRSMLGLDDVVEFMGDVPQHYMRQLLHEAVAFIQPYTASTYTPTALLQAMASSLPVVALEGGLVNQWLSNGHNAMVTPHDATRVAGAVAFLLRKARTGRTLGRAARDTVVRCCGDDKQDIYRVGMLTMRIGMPRRPKQSYLAVTHLHNHSAALEYTMQAMVGQSVRPQEWILVDDGASAPNRDLALKYADAYPWIRVQPAMGDAGPGEVGALYTAMAVAQKDTYQVVVKIDAGVEIDPAHMANILLHLEDHPHVGIASGQLYLHHNGKWLREDSTHQHAFAPAKAFRRTCLDTMGGVPAVQYWDGLDELKARALGWETGHVRALPVYLHGVLFSPRSWWTMRVQQGRHAWHIGFGPHHVAARAVRRAATNPPLLSSVALIAGYADAALHQEPRMHDPVVQKHILKEERERVLRRLKPRHANGSSS